MGFDVIYAIGTIIFTVGGWELGKRVWAAKGADPGRGKWYGAFLGFLFGVFGALTLLAISWRWHPASEPRERRPSGPRTGGLGFVVLAGGAALAATLVTLVLLLDATDYARWSMAMSDTGTAISRAACAEVTGDWDACYVLRAAPRTDTRWKAEWDSQAQSGAIRAGIGLLVGAICWGGFAYAWRRRSMMAAAGRLMAVTPEDPGTPGSDVYGWYTSAGPPGPPRDDTRLS